MSLSVIAPIEPAFQRMKLVLFQPFDLGKWCVMGFTVFLAELGSGGSGSGFNWHGNNSISGDQARQFINRAVTFVNEHVVLITAMVIAVIVLSAALAALLHWLSSRGMFMFLDNVVRNRAAVAEPWRQYAPHGNSLFAVRYTAWLLSAVLGLALLAGAVVLAWPDISAWSFGSAAIIALCTFVPLMIILAIAFVLFNGIMDDFIVPVMYRHTVRAWPAMGIFARHVVRGNVWKVILFYLMCLVLGMAAGALMITLGLLTCCCGCCLMALPYIGSVVLLPISVFFRCYSLYFLAQCGPEWELLTPAPPQAEIAVE